MEFFMLRIPLLHSKLFAMLAIVFVAMAMTVTTGMAGKKRLGTAVSGGKKIHSAYKSHRNFRGGARKFHARSHKAFRKGFRGNKLRHVRHHRSGVRLGAVSGHKHSRIHRQRKYNGIYARRSGVKIMDVPTATVNPKIYVYDNEIGLIEDHLLGDGSDYAITVIKGPSVQPACPVGHNCGYRLYEDGTGPRIITLGVSGKGLPPQDGVSGPRIIRVN